MKYPVLIVLIFNFVLIQSIFSQKAEVKGKALKKTFPDVEQPSLHLAPAVYYTPVTILLNTDQSVSETGYWRKNFTDQFIETWESRMYPASKVFGFIQDSVYFRSTVYNDYHIFVPLILKNKINLYFTRYIQNLGEIRMVSHDTNSPGYSNKMIITGDVPRRYANDFTYFVTFPWDTLKMVTVTRNSLTGFADTYLKIFPDAYKEAMKYKRSSAGKILSYTLIPVAAAGTAGFLLVQGNPVYFIGIGAGAMVSYITAKIFLKPKKLDPEAMIGIIEKCNY